MKFDAEYWLVFLCSPQMFKCYKEIRTQRLLQELVVENVRVVGVWDTA